MKTELQKQSIKNSINDINSIRTFNDMGKRLKWLRETLGLTMREVSVATGFPYATIAHREYGAVPKSMFDFEILARFFDKAWKDKFKDGFYPSYREEVIKFVDENFIMFGRVTDTLEVDLLKAKIRELEIASSEREAELLRQIEVLSRD